MREKVCAFLVLWLSCDDANVRIIINDVGLDDVNDLECVRRVQVTLPLRAGWLDDGVIAIVALLVELAVGAMLLIRLLPALLETI